MSHNAPANAPSRLLSPQPINDRWVWSLRKRVRRWRRVSPLSPRSCRGRWRAHGRYVYGYKGAFNRLIQAEMESEQQVLFFFLFPSLAFFLFLFLFLLPRRRKCSVRLRIRRSGRGGWQTQCGWWFKGLQGMTSMVRRAPSPRTTLSQNDTTSS